jgi:hypothetical protein
MKVWMHANKIKKSLVSGVEVAQKLDAIRHPIFSTFLF